MNGECVCNLITYFLAALFIYMTERSAFLRRASLRRNSDGLHALSPALFSAACIFRALSQCFSPPIVPGNIILISMATQSDRSPAFSMSACMSATPPAWGSLPGLKRIRDNRQWNRYLQAKYGHRRKVHFVKKTVGPVRAVVPKRPPFLRRSSGTTAAVP